MQRETGYRLLCFGAVNELNVAEVRYESVNQFFERNWYTSGTSDFLGCVRGECSFEVCAHLMFHNYSQWVVSSKLSRKRFFE
jgi:hypothetical protein